MMRANRFWMTVLCTICTLSLSAQDAYITDMTSNAKQVNRSPEGDRGYYGLWAKDRLLESPRYKPRYESPADSLRKRNEFVHLCGIAFEAYEAKDALKTVIYGDSALRTGFENQQIFFYMAVSLEKLGDDKRALHFYKEAAAHGYPGGKQALASFKKRAKARKKDAKKN